MASRGAGGDARDDVISFPDPSKGGVSVAVVVRAKPPSPADSPLVVTMTPKSTTITLAHRKTKTPEKSFNFDRCYWSVAKSDPDYASQDTVFNEVRGCEMRRCSVWLWLV